MGGASQLRPIFLGTIASVFLGGNMNPAKAWRFLHLGAFILIFILLCTAKTVPYTAWTLICLGAVCNVLTMIANHGQMPVKGNFTDFMDDGRHVAFSPDTRLRFLCDRYRMIGRRWSPVFSIGDVSLFLGLVIGLLGEIRHVILSLVACL
jgi:lipoprotein signal peptidase